MVVESKTTLYQHYSPALKKKKKYKFRFALLLNFLYSIIGDKLFLKILIYLIQIISHLYLTT